MFANHTSRRNCRREISGFSFQTKTYDGGIKPLRRCSVSSAFARIPFRGAEGERGTFQRGGSPRQVSLRRTGIPKLSRNNFGVVRSRSPEQNKDRRLQAS